MKLGKIKRITDIRSVWHHEEKDFSKWLAQDENLKQLSDAIGLILYWKNESLLLETLV